MLTAGFAVTAVEAVAQVPDSVVSPPDTVVVAPDTALAPVDTVAAPAGIVDSTHAAEKAPPIPSGPPLTLEAYPEGVRSDATPLVRLSAGDMVERLDEFPGSFRYSMGNLGWPDQIAYLGFSPVDIGLTFDGIPMQDPVTSRPLFELVPLDLLRSPAMFSGKHASAAGFALETRRFDVVKPLTELRYRAGSPGLRSISGTHVQQRKTHFLGSPTTLQVLFRYASGAWGGEYPSSSSDVSQVYGRVGLYSSKWALRITNMYTRRHGGAHSGVLVRSGGGFDSIYTRFNAAVENPAAKFRIKRNDFHVKFDRLWLQGLSPLSLQFSWVSHVRRYRNVTTSDALVEEYTFAAAQEIPGLVADQTFTARLINRFDDVRSATVFSDTTGLSRSDVEALLESDYRLGSSDLAGHIGLIDADGHVIPEGRARLKVPLAGYEISSEIVVSGRAPSRLEMLGSDRVAGATSSLGAEHTRLLRLSAERPFGTSSIRIDAFAATTSHPLDLRETAADSFQVMQANAAITWYGVTSILGWRDASKRGLYGELQSTIQASTAPADDAFLTAIDESLPSLQARGRFGARSWLFQNDLRLDVYVIGRYWSSFKSRLYEPVTGLLALPGESARTVGNSGTLDFRMEAGIREATVFVGFENILSGLSYPGTLLVPNYPLPAQAFRFGVFWPIEN